MQIYSAFSTCKRFFGIAFLWHVSLEFPFLSRDPLTHQLCALDDFILLLQWKILTVRHFRCISRYDVEQIHQFIANFVSKTLTSRAPLLVFSRESPNGRNIHCSMKLYASSFDGKFLPTIRLNRFRRQQCILLGKSISQLFFRWLFGFGMKTHRTLILF